MRFLLAMLNTTALSLCGCHGGAPTNANVDEVS